jgi:hypothetical protein
VWSALQSDPLEAVRLFKPELPLFPLAGVATVRTGKTYEIKRYFKNDVEDPFEFLRLQPKNEFRLRYELLLSVARELPEKGVLEIRSHTRVHTLAYRRLGFKVVKTFEEANYPGIQVDLLQGDKQDVVSKIEAILDNQKSGHEAR